MDNFANSRGQRQWISGGAEGIGSFLPVGDTGSAKRPCYTMAGYSPFKSPVPLCSSRLRSPPFAAALLSIGIEHDLLPQWILVPQIHLGPAFVDDGNGNRVRTIPLIELTSGEERNLHRGEECRSNSENMGAQSAAATEASVSVRRAIRFGASRGGRRVNPTFRRPQAASSKP